MMTTIQGPLAGLSSEALRLIKEVAKWRWHPGIYGFVNQLGIPNQKQITRAELAEHRLFGPVSQAECARGIAWLTARLGLRQPAGLYAQPHPEQFSRRDRLVGSATLAAAQAA
jgi:hypothetical protein